MKKRGHCEQAIDRMVFQNPAQFMGQCPKFKLE
jgi:hypothetical protein